MKHIAVYLRVSSRTQDTASQEADLERWAKSQTEPVQFYRDSFTGRRWTGLASVVSSARSLRGMYRPSLCGALDRLGRTAKGLTALFDDLVRRKVNLVSLRDGLDLSTPAGRLMANVLASVAAYETEVRSERRWPASRQPRLRACSSGVP
jgi:DNA invertase Pin-like site-specific DNA recombinase